MSETGPTQEQWAWRIGDDTGISSMTIWHVLTACPMVEKWFPSTPRDPADFGRCRRLLERFPEWRARLPEVAERYPEWRPLVTSWSELERLYLRDLGSARSDELYGFIRGLEAARGWCS